MDTKAIETRLDWLWKTIQELRLSASNAAYPSAKEHLNKTADNYQLEFMELHRQYRIATTRLRPRDIR